MILKDSTKKETETVEIEREDKLFTYDVFERPPIPMTVVCFAGKFRE